MKLVGVGGYAGAGKDAFVDGLVERCEFARTFMSKPLLNALLELNPWIMLENAENCLAMEYFPGSFTKFKILYNAVGYEQAKCEPEVRRLLQILGTEIGRKMFDWNVWVDLMIKEVLELGEKDIPIAVTGIRYQNEMDAIKECGGIAVWIERPGVEAVNAHSSDNTLGMNDFDTVIYNEQGLDELHVAAENFGTSYLMGLI